MNRCSAVKSSGLVAILALFVMTVGCGDDAALNQGPQGIPGSSNLLGLVDGRTMDYIRIDSTVTWLPYYSLSVDTGTQTIRISGSENDWIIYDNATPIINLKVSEPFTLHNGYWSKVGGLDALVTYPVPSVVVDARVSPGDEWESTVPIFTSDSGQVRFPFYYAYFGFHVRKQYTGIQELILPGYAGDAHRFDVKLFTGPADSLPIASAIEFYVGGAGMVKWEFHGDGFSRVLNIRNVF